MATYSSYKCQGCNLRGLLSPGLHRLSAGVFLTGYCWQCESFCAPLLCEGEGGVQLPLSAALKTRFVCYEHPDKPLEIWDTLMPCPRCGGEFVEQQDGVAINVD